MVYDGDLLGVEGWNDSVHIDSVIFSLTIAHGQVGGLQLPYHDGGTYSPCGYCIRLSRPAIRNYGCLKYRRKKAATDGCEKIRVIFSSGATLRHNGIFCKGFVMRLGFLILPVFHRLILRHGFTVHCGIVCCLLEKLFDFNGCPVFGGLGFVICHFFF